VERGDEGGKYPARQGVLRRAMLDGEEILRVAWGPAVLIRAAEGEVAHLGAAQPAAEEGEIVGLWGREVGEEDLLREVFICECAEVCVSRFGMETWRFTSAREREFSKACFREEM
jgi:hypothetical protein